MISCQQIKKDRKRFYWTRSALAHGGKLLAADHNVWGFTPKQLGEDMDARNDGELSKSFFITGWPKSEVAPVRPLRYLNAALLAALR